MNIFVLCDKESDRLKNYLKDDSSINFVRQIEQIPVLSDEINSFEGVVRFLEQKLSFSDILLHNPNIRYDAFKLKTEHPTLTALLDSFALDFDVGFNPQKKRLGYSYSVRTDGLIKNYDRQQLSYTESIISLVKNINSFISEFIQLYFEYLLDLYKLESQKITINLKRERLKHLENHFLAGQLPKFHLDKEINTIETQEIEIRYKELNLISKKNKLISMSGLEVIPNILPNIGIIHVFEDTTTIDPEYIDQIFKIQSDSRFNPIDFSIGFTNSQLEDKKVLSSSLKLSFDNIIRYFISKAYNFEQILIEEGIKMQRIKHHAAIKEIQELKKLIESNEIALVKFYEETFLKNIFKQSSGVLSQNDVLKYVDYVINRMIFLQECRQQVVFNRLKILINDLALYYSNFLIKEKEIFEDLDKTKTDLS